MKSVNKCFQVIDFKVPFLREKNYRELVISNVNGGYSRVPFFNHKEKLLFYDYCKFFITKFIKEELTDALILGGGGCGVPIYLLSRYPESSIDVIEANKEVAEIAKKFFINKFVCKEKRKSINIICNDALIFLKETVGKKNYQFIFINLFENDIVVELVKSGIFIFYLKQMLNDCGILVLNLGKESNIDKDEIFNLYNGFLPGVVLFLNKNSLVMLCRKQIINHDSLDYSCLRQYNLKIVFEKSKYKSS